MNKILNNPNINITKEMVMGANSIKCPKKDCDGDVFLTVIRFKKISKLLAGTPEDLLIPLESMVCAKCGAELSMEELIHPTFNEDSS